MATGIEQLAILSIRFDASKLYEGEEDGEPDYMRGAQHQEWCLGTDGPYQSMLSWYEEEILIDRKDIDEVIEWCDDNDVNLKTIELISEPGKIAYGDSGDAYGFWEDNNGWTVELGSHGSLDQYCYAGEFFTQEEWDERLKKELLDLAPVADHPLPGTRLGNALKRFCLYDTAWISDHYMDAACVAFCDECGDMTSLDNLKSERGVCPKCLPAELEHLETVAGMQRFSDDEG
jgi:hypothetical protein